MSKTIFEKIQDIRVELRNAKLRMTGKNSFAGYEYFELEDFLPMLSILMKKHGITAIPSFTKELATLTAYNFDEPFDKVEITSPFGSAALKGCHEVQSIGAVETYQRRYLYQALFDIGEKDCLNATSNNTKNERTETPKQTLSSNDSSDYYEYNGNYTLSKKAKEKLDNLQEYELPPFMSYLTEQEVLDMGGSVNTVAWIRNTYNVKYFSDLTKEQADEIKRMLEEKKKEKENK